MRKLIKYEDLEKYFTEPPKLQIYSDTERIPRKLKKRVKKYCGVCWNGLTNSQRL